MSKPFYITTTLPYVNAEAHLGHAMEFIRADVVARTKALEGFEVLYNTGADEHGIKIYRKAQEQKLDPQKYVDEYAKKFQELLPLLGIDSAAGIDRHFVRTSSENHKKTAQEFWKLCASKNAPDGQPSIYKKNYKIKYCVGCELEKTDSELVDGKCPLHPALTIELIDEENYFFRFSAFAKPLLDFYASRPDFVVPDFRFNEIKSFVSRGLEDFSISRLKSKMPWGVEVPGDADHVMYVWFDALVSYISTLGWSANGKNQQGFDKWWKETGGVVQYCGKDNLRQQSAMWQAMLMAVGLPASRQIVVNGFVTGENGMKMSKSLGNIVDPVKLVNEYGTEMLRYYVARELSTFEDSPFAMERYKEAYNAGLANGIGNLVSRIMKMAVTNIPKISGEAFELTQKMPKEFSDALNHYEIKKAADFIWEKISALDAIIQREQPFTKVKDPTTKDAALKIIENLVKDLAEISYLLKPILPQTSATIENCIREHKMPEKPLFLRK